MIDIISDEFLTGLKVFSCVYRGSKHVLNVISTKFSNISQTASINLGVAFDNYIDCSKEKNSKIKTILNSKNPKDLYSLYICLGVKNNDIIVDSNHVENILNNGHKLIITGTAGIGKSTLLKHLFLSTLNESYLIPVLIELRNINSNKPLFDEIYGSLSNHDSHFMSEEYFKYSMEKGCYLILFDGFDELNSENLPKVEKEIQAITTKYKNNYYIMTSRPTSVFQGWSDFIEMESMSLTKQQAIDMVKKFECFGYETDIIKQFIEVLGKSLYKTHKSFASNPLLLTIMFITYAERGRCIPDNLNSFYEEAFNALFYLHDDSKGTYKRNIESKLDKDDFKRTFSYLCFKSFFDNKQSMTENELRIYLERAQSKLSLVSFSNDTMINDLTLATCLLVKDGREYTFVHKTLQEYFAAYYIHGLPDEVINKVVLDSFINYNHSGNELFYNMLYELHPDRFNRCVLYQNLKRIIEIYKDSFVIEYLNEVSDGLIIKTGNVNLDNKYYIALSIPLKIKDLFEVINLTCRLHGYSYDNENINNKEFEKYIDTKVTHNDWNDVISYNEIVSDGMENILLQQLKWFKNRTEFALNFFTTIDNMEYKDIPSIIDDL